MNKSWIFGLCILLCIGSVSALNITSPLNNSNVTQYLNTSWVNASGNPPIYNVSLYSGGVFNSTLFVFNSTIISSPVSVQSSSLCNAYASSSWSNVNQFGSSLNWSVCSSSSAYYGQGYVVVNYVDGSSTTSPTYQAVSTSCPQYSLSLDSSKVVSSVVAYTCAVATSNHDSLTSVISFVPSTNNFLSTDLFPLNLSTGVYGVNVSAYNSSFGLVDSNVSFFNLLFNSLVNVSVRDYLGNPVNVASLVLTDSVTNVSYSYSTSNSLFSVPIVRSRLYNVFVNSSNWVSYNQSFTPSNSPSQSLSISLLPYNSVFFNFFNESDGSKVLSSVVVGLQDSSNHSYSGSSSNGSLIFQNVSTGSYTATFTSATFSIRQLYVTVIDGSSQVINVYLPLNASPILFNTKNNGGNILPGVLCVLRSYVNNSIVPVQSGLSDGTGRLQFSLLSNKYYDLNCSLSGYQSSFSILNPVLFSSYDIALGLFSSAGVSPSGYASYSPQSFRRGSPVNFQIQFFSPYNSFVNYSYNVSYPTGSIAGFGSSPGGSLLSDSFTPGAGSVTVFYQWSLSNNVSQNFTSVYSVVNVASNRTMSSSQGNYGMLIGDLVLRDSFILILLMGLGWLAFGFFGGLAVGGLTLSLILGTGAYTPQQSVIFGASGVLIVLFLIFRGKQ